MTDLLDGFMWGILVTLTAISIMFKVEKWIRIWLINRRIKKIQEKIDWSSQPNDSVEIP